MTKKVKIGLGVVAMAALVAITVVSTSSTLFQGKLTFSKQATQEKEITKCDFIKQIVVAKGLDLLSPQDQTFRDVPKNSWCYAYVETAYEAGYINTAVDNNFYPSNKELRMNAAKLIVVAWELPLISPPEPTFKDVSKNAWYYSYVESLYSLLGTNICNGEQKCIHGYFSPLANVTNLWTEALIKKVKES